jgi:hypothetical protein
VIVTCPVGHPFTVVFGDPTPETMERAKRHEIVLGGCIPDVPMEHPCPECGRVVLVSEGSGWGSGEPTDDA